MEFGYTYEGLKRWLAEDTWRSYEEFEDTIVDCEVKKREPTTTNSMWIEINRCLDVLKIMLMITAAAESSFNSEEEEESDDEEDPS